jgi:hypothetical protein
MKKTRFFGLLIVIGLISVAGVFAQSGSHHVFVDIPSIAMLSVDGGDVTLEVTEPALPGQIPTGDTDATTALFYTSLIPNLGSHIITVGAGASPAVPTGVTVTVKATTISTLVGVGGTAVASPVSFANILGSSTNLVTAIGSCYTGRDPGSGATLTYTLSFADFTALSALAAAADFTITYTITQ